MGLSEREQRLLDEMERSLYSSDADFLAPDTSASYNYRNIVLGSLVVVLGLVLLISAVATGILWLGILAFAVMFSGVLFALKKDKTKPKSNGLGAAKNKSAGNSFFQNLSARWEDRNL